MKPKSTLGSVLLFFAFTGFVLSGNAQSIIAQQTSFDGGSYLSLVNTNDPEFGNDYQGVGESFKSAVTGNIGTLQFYINHLNGAGTVDIQLYNCTSPTAWGSLIATKAGVPVNSTGWVNADLTTLNIPVVAGNFYGYRLLPNDPLDAGSAYSSAAYPNGAIVAVQSDGSQSNTSGHFAFIVTSAAPLPVTLLSFTAQKQGSQALLRWSTALEQNSKDFRVQRSSNGVDGWSDIATLSAAGNSNSPLQYSYTDTKPLAGSDYYRLLEVDLDGKSSYSPVCVVAFPKATASFSILANPVSYGQLLQVQVNRAGTFALYDAGGSRLWTAQLGQGVQDLDIGRYGKGVFILKGEDMVVRVLVK